MKFDDLDKKMRVFETAHDTHVVPETFIVARIDGRGFTRLTKEVHKFEAPYDERFRDYMIATTEHLMNCGFRIVYGYTQSDEISLLLHRDETLFDRKVRKLTSVLAGEASARFTLALGAVACFDCRICELPNERLVIDYFRWRSEDALRNALNAHCYWLLRKEGATVKEATARLLGIPVADKHELLFTKGINFAKLPAWQRRGIGLYWEDFEKEGRNPKTGAVTKTTRRRIKADLDLPMKDAYSELVKRLVRASAAPIE
jgi:tRNA(His) guanylyltransferase